jgi:hypothetical protein
VGSTIIKWILRMAFWNISLDTANQFYAWGWRASIAGAIITAVAVSFLMWGHELETTILNHK